MPGPGEEWKYLQAAPAGDQRLRLSESVYSLAGLRARAAGDHRLVGYGAPVHRLADTLWVPVSRVRPHPLAS